MSKVYVLVREENDYHQYGQYFVAVYRTTPTLEQLAKHGTDHYGRVNYENTWFELLEENVS